MSFDYHSDVAEHPAFTGDNGLGAMGLWVRCGSWTSANGRTGIVPRAVAEDYGDADLIAKLVDNGMWQPTADGTGYEMLRGPSAELPLPLWRYGDKPDDGRLLSVDTDSLE